MSWVVWSLKVTVRPRRAAVKPATTGESAGLIMQAGLGRRRRCRPPGDDLEDFCLGQRRQSALRAGVDLVLPDAIICVADAISRAVEEYRRSTAALLDADHSSLDITLQLLQAPRA